MARLYLAMLWQDIAIINFRKYPKTKIWNFLKQFSVKIEYVYIDKMCPIVYNHFKHF